MSLRYGLLGLLNYSEATGYELKKAFDESLNFFWQAQKSQIYRELAAMEKQGLLTVSLVIQEDKPNKKVYSITDAGRKEFLQWLEKDLDEHDFTVRDSFVMKVFFWGELSPLHAVEKLKAFIKTHQQKLESYRAISGSIERYTELVEREKTLYWYISARRGFAYSESCITWAEEAVALLKNTFALQKGEKR